jgi:hypothetical protein
MRGFVRLAIEGIRKHETELVFALKNGKYNARNRGGNFGEVSTPLQSIHLDV